MSEGIKGSHFKRYLLVMPYWANGRAISGVAANFKTLALGLMERGDTVQLMVLDWERSWRLPDTVEMEDGIRVVRVGIELPKFFKGRFLFLNLLLSPRFGGIFVAWFKVLARLGNRPGQAWDGVITTNYHGLALLHCLLRARPLVLVRVSTMQEQIAGYELEGKEGKLGQYLTRFEVLVENLGIRRAHLLSSHSARHIERLNERFGFASGRVFSIPHGLPSRPTTAPGGYTQRRVLYVGRMEKRKGIDILMAAIPGVVAVVPEVEFVIVGDDPTRCVEVWWKTLDTTTQQRVQVKGRVSDEEKDRCLDDCSILVCPSHYESFGRAYLEGMIRGKPVIACKDSGATEEVVGEGGVLIPKSDAEALREVLIDLLTNPAKREALSQQARTQASRFTLDKTLEALDQAFASVRVGR